MRTPFIAGNWKMNLTSREARDFARALKATCQREDVEVAVAPTFTALAAVIDELMGSRIAVAAQNCHWESAGAYTGEISAEMIKEIGCSHVIIGHSERRQHFGETDEWVNKKLHAAYRCGLLPIVCLGETLAEREGGRTMDVVRRQFEVALQGVSAEQMLKTTIAYEPVWAIGTGKTATPEQAQEVHGAVRGLLHKKFAPRVADQVRLQYGGSVKADNIEKLMSQPDIDGALVGGASLKADSFAGIVNYKR